MKNSLMCQVFSRFSSQRYKTDHPEMRSSDVAESVWRQRGGDFVFPKRAKRIKIVSVEEMPEAQRKLEQGHTGCPRRI
jgi:hypothetical protein